jgi:Hsp70 protein
MDSMVPFIGIDFGTSKSSMAWYDPRFGRAEIILNAEGKQITPSVVYLGPTESETLVGDPAERKLGQEKVDQRRFVLSVKRDLMRASTKILDSKVYSPVKVTSLILAKLREDADKRHFKQPVDRVVITHPASFNTLQQDKIKEAAILAGFSQVELLPEPVAAALTYAYTGLKVGQYIMVYDFGGGTFDVAVLQRISDGTFRRALASRGLPKCGGDDLDRAVYKYCEEIVQREKKRQISLTDEYDLRFLRLCRECKENLTSQRDYTFSNYLPSNNGPVLFEHTLDRSTFESRVRDYISQTITLTQEVMQEANGKGCQVNTVVLIGGSSRVPLVWHSLVGSLSVKPDEWQYQDIAVALGAAYHAQELWGTESSSGVHPSEPEEEYRAAVKDAWANNTLSKTKVNDLAAKAQTLGLSGDKAAGIEREIMGGTKEELLKRLQTPPPPPPTPPPPPPPHQFRSSPKRTRAPLVGILAVLLIIISIVVGIVVYNQQQQNTPATATAQSDQATQDAITAQQTQDAQAATATAQSDQATQDAITAQQTQDAQATQTALAAFPVIQGTYSGTYQDSTSSTSSPMSLTISQQNQQSWTGSCTLQGTNGSPSNFTITNGTVDQSGNITFSINGTDANGNNVTVTFSSTQPDVTGWTGTYSFTNGNSGTWTVM